jgi:hypothetical protein
MKWAINLSVFRLVQILLPTLVILCSVAVLLGRWHAARRGYRILPSTEHDAASVTDGPRVTSYEQEDEDERAAALIDTATGLPMIESEAYWSRLDLAKLLLSVAACIITILHAVWRREQSPTIALYALLAPGVMAVGWFYVAVLSLKRLQSGKWGWARILLPHQTLVCVV